MADPNDIKWDEATPSDIQWEAPAAPAPKPSLLRRMVADPAISALKGAIGVPEAIVGVADIATQGGAGKLAEAVGFRPKEAKATLDSLYSPEQQRANEAVAQADGIIPTIKASLRNPSTIIHSAIESAPSMLPAGGAAQLLVRRGVPAVVAAAAGEGLVSAGQTAEQVRQDTGDLKGTKPLIAAGSGALTGGLGLAGGKAAQKMGIADLDVMLAGGAKPTKTATAKAIAGGVISEGLLEETPQSAQEQAAQNLAEGKPLGEGVAKAAVQGGIVGGAMGGGTAAVTNILTPKSETKAKVEEIQALPPEEQKPAVAELAAEIAPEAPAHVEAAILDKLDAGEVLAPEAEPVTREKVLDALTESIASGGEIDPLEAMQGAEEQQVLEALRKEVPMEAPMEQGEEAPDTIQIRADRWLQQGTIPVKEGQAPDAEVAARLDDMGYMLEKGGRGDLKSGGAVATREWVVKPVALGEGERRQAYPENPNVLIERQGDRVAVFDDKNKEIIGIAETKDGKFSGWVDNFEPMTVEERSQVEGLVNRHMSGEARFSRVSTPITLRADGTFEYNDGKMYVRGVDQGGGEVYIVAAEKNPQVSEKGLYAPALDSIVAQLRAAGREVTKVTGDSSPAAVASRKKAYGERFKITGPDEYGSIPTEIDFSEPSDTRLSRKLAPDEVRRVRTQSIKIHLAPIIQKLSIPVEVVENSLEIPNLNTDVDFSGVYHNGKIYINAGNIYSLKEAERILLDHELRHAGLRSIMDKKELNSLLAAVWGDLKSGVREFAKEKGIDVSTKEGKLEAAEEYMVELSTAEPTPLWTKLLNILKGALRRLGFSVRYTDDELRSLVSRAGEAMFTERQRSDATVSRFSRTPKEAVNDLTAKAASQIAARTLSDVSGNIWRAIMPIDRTIKMAQSMGRYQPIWKQLGEYLVHKRAKAAATNAAPTLAHTYVDEFGKAFKNDAEVQAFNDLTAKATLYELHADGRTAGWTEKSWEDAGKLELTGKTLGEAMTEVKKLYAQLTPAQKAVHGKIIDHMKVLNDQVREAQLEPLKATFGEEDFNHALGLAPTLFNLDDAGREALSKAVGSQVFSLAEQIASIQSEGRLKGDYAPLMRFGEHIVRTFDAEGNRIKTEAFESKQVADNAIQKIRAAGLRPEYEVQAEADRTSTNIPLAFLDKMRAAAEQRGLSGEALDALMDDFKAARLNTLPRYNLAANGLRREGVEGYSTDMLRAYALYTSRAGRSIANLKYGIKIEQTFRDMAGAIQAYQDNKSGWTPHAVERMSRLMNDLRHLEMQGNSEKINELTKALGKSTFLWYLSSPSVWAVQWSQPFMTTIPKMAARYGFPKAMSAYLAEAKRYMAGEFSDEKIEEFNSAHENAGERLFALIEEERALRSKAGARMDAFFAETKGLNGVEALQVVTKQKDELKARADGLRKAMRELYNGFDAKGQRLLILKVLGLQGMLDLSSSHMIQDLITGANEGDKALSKIVEKGAFFMQKSETGSRRAAAVSAFQLALEGGRDFMESNDYAANIIDDTLADFSSQNRPQLMRGNVGRVVGQFQFFRFHMLGKVIQLAKDAYKEDGWGEHKKELAYMTGMTAALAGAAGTPLAMVFSNSAVQLVLAAASAAFGDPDDPWDLEHEFSLAVKEALGEEAGNVFLKGLPSLLGMDVSKRIGMGGMANVLQGEPPPGLSATERAQWYASRAFGPSYGLFSDGLRFFDKLVERDLVGAAAVSSPKVLKDMFKAYQLSNEGAKGVGGKTAIQPEDISPTSIALQMLGINPAEVALVQEERREVANLSASLRERRTLLMSRVTEATMDGDYDKRAEALEAVNQWGLKQPKLAITQGEMLAAVKRGMKAKAGILSPREEALKEAVKGEGP